MNEFAYPGQQPADNPRRRLRRPTTPSDPRLPPPSPQRPGSWRSPADRPVQVRLVWNGWTGAIEGVRIRNPDRPDRPTYASVRPTGSLAADVRQAFADFLAEGIVDAVWPVPSTGMGSPASSAELLTVAEELLDPRLLAANLVGATVQVAAVHAGIPPPVARVMGKAAQDLLVSLLSPDPDARKVEAVQYVDLTLSAEDGSLINSPALPERVVGETANVIDKLLDPDGRQLPRGPVPEPAAPGGQPRKPLRLPRPDHTGAPRPAPPGWYTVPGTTTERWWDGARWTDHRPSPSPGPEPGGEGPSPISF
jgi:hypothetical protein